MKDKFKIILNYIKDLSVEIPDPEALLISRENIKKYSLEINISSNHLKNKMLEVITKLNYKDPSNNKKKSNFEIQYSTIVQILDEKIDKNELKKIILCDVQIEIYPKLEEIFLNILKNSGFPNINFEKKIDFEKLYKEKNN